MRYLVAEGAIGPRGRRVRCAHCGHQWHEQGEEGLDEELFAADVPFVGSSVDEAVDLEENSDFSSVLQKEIDSIPIPEGVRPLRDEVVIPPASRRRFGWLPRLSDDRFRGFAAAFAVYLAVIGVLVVFQPQVSRLWPPSNLVFGLFGMTPAMPGEGLTFSDLSARADNGKIALQGTIVNLKNAENAVPPVMASIMDAKGKLIDRVLISPPVARLKAEGQATFDAVYPKIPDGADGVSYAFSFIQVEKMP